jgi:hypothetical protein
LNIPEVVSTEKSNRRCESRRVRSIDPSNFRNFPEWAWLSVPARAKADELNVAWLTVRGTDNGIQVANGLRDKNNTKFFMQLPLKRRLRRFVLFNLAAG